jgi:N-methylhydantoinase B
MSIDPITTEVIASRLAEIAGSMEYALYHSGYSPILRESKDGTAGLTDAKGRVVMLSGGLQYHVLAYEKAVQEVMRRYPGDRMKPGDSFIANDPYLAGNAHAPDLVAVSPAFHPDGTLVGFGVSIAHKADIGGIVPGSSGAAAREIFHDGLLLPAVRFQTSAGIEEAIDAIVRNNSRVPDMVLGDIRAQVGCTRLGADRLVELCDEYGVATVCDSMDGLIAVTSQRLKNEVALWPDGVGEADGFLDHDGATLSRPVRVHVRAEKRGDMVILDFSGSDPQTAGPVNLVTTITRAVSLLSLVATADPTIRVNAGIIDAIDFILPDGLVLSPARPATVNHYFPTAHLVYCCVLAALARINPARAIAPSGLGCGGASVGYAKSRSGKPAVLYELMVTSLGGTSRHDGASIVHPMSHFTPSTPIEILETEYPVRVKRFDIRCDSAGAGRYRGGIGYIREYEVLEDCVLTVRSSNHQNPAWGVQDGHCPLPSRVILNPDGPSPELLGPIVTRQLNSGDVLRFEQSGGGGFGAPDGRDEAEVLDDVRNGYVSIEAAKTIYGRTIAAKGLEEPTA